MAAYRVREEEDTVPVFTAVLFTFLSNDYVMQLLLGFGALPGLAFRILALVMRNEFANPFQVQVNVLFCETPGRGVLGIG